MPHSLEVDGKDGRSMYVGMGHTVSGLLTGVLSRADVALWVITMFGLLIFMGVVLPSVWSAKPARRRAAREVLRQILDFLRAWFQ